MSRKDARLLANDKFFKAFCKGELVKCRYDDTKDWIDAELTDWLNVDWLAIDIHSQKVGCKDKANMPDFKIMLDMHTVYIIKYKSKYGDIQFSPVIKTKEQAEDLIKNSGSIMKNTEIVEIEI